MKNLKEKSFIKSLNKIIKEMEVLNNAGNDFAGTYIDITAFKNAYLLFEDVREAIKNDMKP